MYRTFRKPSARGIILAFILATLAGGCVGQIGAGGPGVPGSNGQPGPGPSSGSGTGSKPTIKPGDFQVPAEDIQVLPFSVRLQKVAAVVGVPVGDPLMNSLRDNRVSLGDYDFANSRQPDKTWTALKVADWVRAIKPICASSQMRARYSALPEKLPQLIEAAYGRSATPEETAAVASSAVGLMADASRYDTICLAMLSSLEFVAQ